MAGMISQYNWKKYKYNFVLQKVRLRGIIYPDKRTLGCAILLYVLNLHYFYGIPILSSMMSGLLYLSGRQIGDCGYPPGFGWESE